MGKLCSALRELPQSPAVRCIQKREFIMFRREASHPCPPTVQPVGHRRRFSEPSTGRLIARCVRDQHVLRSSVRHHRREVCDPHRRPSVGKPASVGTPRTRRPSTRHIVRPNPGAGFLLADSRSWLSRWAAPQPPHRRWEYGVAALTRCIEGVSRLQVGETPTSRRWMSYRDAVAEPWAFAADGSPDRQSPWLSSSARSGVCTRRSSTSR